MSVPQTLVGHLSMLGYVVISAWYLGIFPCPLPLVLVPLVAPPAEHPTHVHAFRLSVNIILTGCLPPEITE
jgi:hypothetical protein